MKKPAISLHAVLPLDDCQKLSRAQVGQRVHDLVDLSTLQLPLPETFVLSVDFLTLIADHNSFSTKFEQLFHLTPWENAQSVAEQSRIAQEYIRHAEIPEQVSFLLAQAYSQWFDHQYLAVRPSFVMDVENTAHLSDLNVFGEVSLVESLLNVWAKAYQPSKLRQRYIEWQQGNRLPMAIIIQRMVQASCSGYVVTGKNEKGHAPSVEIFAGWGIVHPDHVPATDLDRFEIELKTNEVVEHHIQPKHTEWISQPDALHPKAVPAIRQTQPAITKHQLAELMDHVEKIGKKIFFPQRIEWAIEKDHLYILSVEQLHQTLPVKNSPKESSVVVSPTAEYFQSLEVIAEMRTEHTPHQTNQQPLALLFDTTEVIKNLPAHPSYLLQKQPNRLKDAIEKQLQKILKTHPQRKLIYRSTSAESSLVKELPHHEAFTVQEKNPFLGYRGAVRHIHHYDLFDLELDILTDLHQHTKQKIGLLLPWVRQVRELQQITKHLDQPPFFSRTFVELWLECNTPATVLQLDSFLHQGISHVVFNLADLHSLLLGIDPQSPEISQLYAWDLSLLELLIAPAVKHAQKMNVLCYVLLPQEKPEMMEWAHTLGMKGIVFASSV